MHLNCLILGHEISKVFQLNIHGGENIGKLKETIKATKRVFKDVYTDELELYKVSLPKDNLTKELVQEALNQLLDDNFDKLSRCFFGAPADYLHIVIKPPYPSELTLNCLVLGDEIPMIFQVEISSSKYIGHLKKAIKAKDHALVNADANQLRLYKVSLPHNDKLTKELVVEALNQPLKHATHALSQCFSSAPLAGHLHIVVDLPAHLKEEPQVQKQKDILTRMEQLYNLTTTTLAHTPSQFTKSTEYFRNQIGDRRIMDGRCAVTHPVNTIAAPIQLFNPAFAYFTSKAFDPEYKVPSDFARNVWDLMGRFACIYLTEQNRRDSIRTSLEKVIGRPLTLAMNSDKALPDPVVLSGDEEHQLYLAIGEDKKEVGDGGSDPSVQATFSYLRMFCQHEQAANMKCCCPAFIIAHGGPWLTILGGIITTHCVVQRLTDFLWIPARSTHDDNHFFENVRVLYALRESIEYLDSWHIGILPTVQPYLSNGTPHPRFFPSPDTYILDGVHIKFEYQQPLESSVSCVTYLARTIQESPTDSPPIDVVVKFVTRYGLEVHQEMAKNGFAPKLLYYGQINVYDTMPSYGNLQMVVVERVKGITFEDAVQQKKVPERFKSDLEQAIKQLHAGGYVFGDLRPPNIIVPEDNAVKVQLIDFDWAGKDGQVTYPVSISRSINWPRRVQGLEVIRKEDDLDMLQKLFSLL